MAEPTADKLVLTEIGKAGERQYTNWLYRNLAIIRDILSPGIDTTFIDNDGNTITVRNGLITAKTPP